MLLSEMDIAKRTVTALNKVGIYTQNDLLTTVPTKYLDFLEYKALPDAIGKNCPIHGHVESVNKKLTNNITMITAHIIDLNSGEPLHVKWFGKNFLYEHIKSLRQCEVVVCGIVSYDPIYGYSIVNPYSITEESHFKKEIVPVYRKIKGVSEEMRISLLQKLISNAEDPVEEHIVQKAKLSDYKSALYNVHFPKTMESIKNGDNRLLFNDLLYFTLKLEQNNQKTKVASPYVVTKDTVTTTFLNGLSYQLTKDQKYVYDKIKKQMCSKERANVLIQGDVGCGKTIVSFLFMFLMAENQYQSVIMAPTTVLARQHYQELDAYAKQYGFKTAFLSTELKGKEKNTLLKQIAEGEIDFIVGTHSVIGQKVNYKNLGLVITDEEHRFGVAQKQALADKAITGAHIISLSATPIPRSLAGVIYGSDKEVVAIKSMPKGRIPIQTAINSSDRVIYEFLEKQIKAGRQVYVVCPLIEEDFDGIMKDVESVEETEKKYTSYFASRGIKIGTVTGKMKKAESDEIIESYVKGEIDILISTTVIEVGVNVPNASVIVINNAERFGLATLHQLRGRVGRGKHKSYCILKSTEKQNERLLTMVSTTDGFEIAEKDLQLRGSGDLIGIKQSGVNRYVEQMLINPRLYEAIKKYAAWMNQNSIGNDLIALYEERGE